jgi:hypothetical protein
MEDFESDDTTRDRLVPGEPIREASTATKEKDVELVYDHTCFRRDKVSRRYSRYYHGHRIIIEKGAAIEEFDERALKVQAVLDVQGWIDMIEDHCLEVETIVWEFYVNLHERCGDSFCTWPRGTAIEVTPKLISAITGAPSVRDLSYPYPVDHLPAREPGSMFHRGVPSSDGARGRG